MNDNTIVFTHILLTFSLLLNKTIETFIDFLKHVGDLGINSGLPTLENSFDELGEDKLVFRGVYDTGVCHRPVSVAENKFALRIDTYLLIVTIISSVDSLNCYIITFTVIFDVFQLDVIEY